MILCCYIVSCNKIDLEDYGLIVFQSGWSSLAIRYTKVTTTSIVSSNKLQRREDGHYDSAL